MRYLRGVLVAGVAWFAAGCMQFDYGITLEEDLSGTADVDIAIDLDRVAYMSAYIQNAFAGEGGEPSDEQIQAAVRSSCRRSTRTRTSARNRCGPRSKRTCRMV
jgi:hypothetical protein